jgi:hypothetical protein
MSTGAARRLAWGLLALNLALGAGAIALSALNRADSAIRDDGDFAFTIGFVLIALLMGAVGALVAARRPGNAVGWVLDAGSAVLALASLAEGWALRALFEDPGALPGGEVMAWVSQWCFLPAVVQIPSLLLLLFPDGRPPSRRWRPAVWLAVAATGALALGTALAPAYIGYEEFQGVPGPFGVEQLRGVGQVLWVVGLVGTAVAVPIAAAGMVARLRRARGVERQQVKWVATAAAIFAVAVLATMAGVAAGHVDVAALMILTFPLIPLSAGVAILRHRIYDIDLVINRALVYGALTALLAASYVGLVLLLGAALSPVTSGSDLAIALSTLAVAALFRPVRGRVQTLVDRRFYRHKYDAERTLERFASRLRAETDLEALHSELLGVVRESMAPAHVSLWLRGPGR